MGCNDNCNPASLPVIQGIQGPKGNTGDTGPKGDTGDQGPPGPSELFIGKTLYVSKLGDDATAVPYDIANHYLTITAAKTAAVAGDVIVVHPGIYNEDSLYKDGVNYHFINGAIINLTSTPAFTVSDATGVCNVSGDLEVTGTANSVLNTTGTNCQVSFECKKIDVAGIAFNLQNGTINVNVKESAAASSIVLFAISGNSDIIFTAKKLFWTGDSETLNLFAGIILMGQNHTGNCVITVDEMSNIGSGGCNMITLGGTPGVLGSIIIRCPKVINNFKGFPTVGLFLANKLHYVRFEGNIYSSDPGSLAAGVWSSVGELNTNFSNLFDHNVEIIGDIYVNTNYAMLINNGPARIKYSGNMYGRQDGSLFIGTQWPAPIPNGGPSDTPVEFLIFIGRQTVTSDGSWGPEIESFVWIKDSTLNQFVEGSICIFKRQANLYPIGGPYYPNPTYEKDQYLELDNVKLYVPIAEGAVCIDGDTPAALLTNSVQINACSATMDVSANITVTGEPILLNTNLVSFDNTYITWS